MIHLIPVSFEAGADEDLAAVHILVAGVHIDIAAVHIDEAAVHMLRAAAHIECSRVNLMKDAVLQACADP